MRNIEIVGRRINEIRTLRGYTAKKFCEEAKVSKNTLRNIERGWGDPSLSILERIADILGVALGDLFIEYSQHGRLRPPKILAKT